MKRLPILLFGFSLIGPVVLIVIAWQTYPQPLWLGLAVGAALWLGGSFLMFSVYSRNKNKELKQQPLREKISELQSQGVDLHHEEEVALTTNDSNKLKSAIRNTALFILIAISAGLAIVYFFSDHGVLPIIILSLFSLVIVIMATGSILSIQEILKNNKKMVIRGIITHERQEITGTGKSRRIKYFKTIGNRELQVNVNLNKRYQLGNAVEIHYALNGKMMPFIFEDKLLPDGGISV